MSTMIKKFRIYDWGRGEWVHGKPMDKHAQDIGCDSIDLFGETIVFGELLRRDSDDSCITLRELSNLEASQYIGAEDKNGLSIFEGDICEDSDKGLLGIVRYDSQLLMWEMYSSEGLWGVSPQFLTIVGNKFDNRDLYQKIIKKGEGSNEFQN